MPTFLSRRFRVRKPDRERPAARVPLRSECLEDRTVPACISPDPFICAPLPPSHQGLAVHIHPHVQVLVNGRDLPIPANLGIMVDAQGRATGFLPIHTHDGTGTLHVESPTARGFTLKDFFDSWGFVLSSTELAGFLTEAGRSVRLTVNGQASAALGSLPLRDGDHIVVQADGAFPAANLVAAAHVFTHSPENYGGFITQAYQRYLGRNPEPAGLDGWIRRMQQGLTDEQLEANFIGSAEYIANHGGTGAAWVMGLYKDLLGRAPDPAGLRAWLDRLSAGTQPYDIAFGFAASAEREGIRVREDYVTFLGRGPIRAEVDGWVTRFLQGASNEDVVAGFVGSHEYFYNPAKGKGTRADWVRSAYRDVLHRAPSAGEVHTWVAALSRV